MQSSFPPKELESRSRARTSHQLVSQPFKQRRFVSRRRTYLDGKCYAYSLDNNSITSPVKVEVDKVSGNTRRLYAGITIRAPLKFVWQALTDYAGLSKFIPGLAENRCLQRHSRGARLLQIGEQQIALGAKFRAKVVLDIEEYDCGVPAHLCSVLNGSNLLSGFNSSALDLYPRPRSQASDGQPQDIAFTMVEGDFTAFRGIWRMQAPTAETTRLTYSLHVQPQRWLPVRLIQGRIEGEIAVNLNAVRIYTEQLSLLQ